MVIWGFPAVQVAGGGGGSLHGQVDIFSLNRTTPRLVKSVPLRSSVLCLELVKESGPQTEEEEEAGRVTRAGNIICVGLQDGRSETFKTFSVLHNLSLLQPSTLFDFIFVYFLSQLQDLLCVSST